MSEHPQLQKTLFNLLSKRFPIVANEWNAFKGNRRGQYGPRVDIAVGPFNDGSGPYNLSAEYNLLVDESGNRQLLSRLYEHHMTNLDVKVYEHVVFPSLEEVRHRNLNARCLLAIEIENSNSKKHMMGSVINAASLGRVGIGIGYNSNALKTFLRIVNYLAFLKKVEKNGYDTCNFLVLTPDQMIQALSESPITSDNLQFS